MFALVAVRVFEMPCRWPIHITPIDADIVAGVGNLHACFISALVAVRDFGLPCRWLLRLTSLAADMAAGVRTTWLATRLGGVSPWRLRRRAAGRGHILMELRRGGRAAVSTARVCRWAAHNGHN